jgi:hypothetical protein
MAINIFFVMAGGFNVKTNIFDLQNDKKLFRDLALAFNIQLSALTSERTDQIFLQTGLIIGTYHSFTHSELELVFISSAHKTFLESKYEHLSSGIEANMVDLGLGAIYRAGKNRHSQLNGGCFYRIPYSVHSHYRTGPYVNNVSNVSFVNNFSPWVGNLGFTIEIRK